jgi:glycosyltransferase involved in cell wall biosynthesis
MIGIVTRYRKQDATFAALAVARRMDATARPCSLFCYDWRVGSIDPTYDNRVRKCSFRQWLSKVKHIVWTAPVDGYFIDQAQRKGVRSTLYTSWDQLEQYDERVLHEYSHVIVPSAVQAMQLRDRFKLRNVAVLPYDCGMPHTDKSDSSRGDGRIRLFLSLYGTQLHRVDLSAILILAGLVNDFANVDVTVACSKGLALYMLRELKWLRKRHQDRWRNLWDCPWNEQVIEMAEHDLTVWPAKWDGFGLVGSTSLAMGTPVISWDVNPINEHLSSGRNSILVSCDVEYNWLGVPHVKPDYEEFDYVLRWLLQEPNALTELTKRTSAQLDERREDGSKGWDAILPAAV